MHLPKQREKDRHARPSAELGWYLERIESIPSLTPVQEKRLARRLGEHSDPVARERLILSNLHLVVKIARSYCRPGVSLEDLVAEGNVGLISAVDRINPDADQRFCSYAYWWISGAVRRAVYKTNQIINIPVDIMCLITKWHRATSELRAQPGRMPTTEEIAGKLTIGPRRAQTVRQSMMLLEAASQRGSDDMAVISRIPTRDDSDLPEQALMGAADSAIAQALVDTVDQHRRRILELRFGLGASGGRMHTFKEIGGILGQSAQWVGRLQKQTLDILRRRAARML